jgi:hypothetical protein
VDLFTAYELSEEFTLHEASYLLLGHQPLPLGFPPKNDPHELIRHRASTLASQLISHARTDKLRATYEDSGGVCVLTAAWRWTVTRKDLKDWAKINLVRPAFLFPPLPPLDTVHNVCAAEAGRIGTKRPALTLEYRLALLRIARQINNGQLVAYVLDSSGDFEKLKGHDASVLQMRAFLFDNMNSEENFKNRFTDDNKYDENPASLNMDWAEQIHISPDVACKPFPAPQKVRPMRPFPLEAKQDGGVGRDVLAPAIERAIREARSKQFSAVYLKLRESALNGEEPFKGVIDDNGALCYTNSQNKQSKLTTAALKKRLQRRRAARGQ